MEASCCVARKIFLSPAMASSNARTLDSRPTTNGVIMYGKMTTSRMGIMGSFLVSNFSRWVTNNRLITPGRKAAPRWRVRNWLCNQVLRALQRSHNPGNQRISREASQQTLRRTCNSSRDSRREQSEQEWDISEISSAIPWLSWMRLRAIRFLPPAQLRFSPNTRPTTTSSPRLLQGRQANVAVFDHFPGDFKIPDPFLARQGVHEVEHQIF